MKLSQNTISPEDALADCQFFIHLSDQQLPSALIAVAEANLQYNVMTWAKNCGIAQGDTLRYDAEYYLFVRPGKGIRGENKTPQDNRR